MDRKSSAFSFFWDRYHERDQWHLRKNSESLPELTMQIDSFKPAEMTPDSKVVCMICGGFLDKEYCKDCTNLAEGHNNHSVYFAVEHFNEKEYIIVFLIKKDWTPIPEKKYPSF